MCVLDAKFTTSTYCCNELVMAQSCGLKLFPIMFREQTFQQLPAGLRYGLSTTNCSNFLGAESDEPNMAELLVRCCGTAACALQQWVDGGGGGGGR